MTDLQVSIVTHDNAATVAACLESVRAETSRLEVAIDVVDNASTDDTAAQIAGFDGVRVHRSDDNVGFGVAHNRVLAATTAPLVLLLNPDARLLPGALGRLRETLVADPVLALVGPRLQSPTGSPEVSHGPFPGVLADLRQRRRTRATDRDDPAVVRQLETELTGPFRPDWISGACMLGRTATLRDVGWFDPRFFLYLEDVDLCLRLRQAGHEVALEPRAVCVHERGASLPDRDAAQRHYRASRLAFEEKHGTRLGAFLYRHLRT